MAMDWTDVKDGKEIIITRNLSLDSVAKTSRELKLLQKDIDNAIEKGIQDSVIKIKEKLITILVKYGISVLEKDIKITTYKLGFEIELASESAAFIEYGTGIVGQNSPHPEDPWPYDINKHGARGWMAPLDELDSAGVDTGKLIIEGKPYARTRGMPSRPYFWELQKWIASYGIVTRSINKRLRSLKFVS